jgi:ABC-2 type transport system permease protein
MIHRVMVRSYIGQSMLLWLSCGSALFAFAWVRVWVTSLLDMRQFRTILEQFREFEKFAPIEFDAMFTYPGRVGMTFDEPIVILCTVIWCIARGSDCISGELGRGTLEMLLAQPITRRQLLLSHATVSVTGLALLCLLVWAGMYVGVQTTTIEESLPGPTLTIPWVNVEVPLAGAEPQKLSMSLADRVDSSIFAAPTFHLFAFGFFLLGLSTFISSIDRYRWRTVGTVVGFYVVQLVMFGLSKATPKLEWLGDVSFFSCYKPQKVVTLAVNESLSAPWSLVTQTPGADFPPLVYPLILLGLGIAAYTSASICFTRRDLPAPL